MRRLYVLALASSFAPVCSAWALDPDRGITQYILEVWTSHQGAPSGAISGIAQTQDGYLWLGTETEGLIQFDGLSFRRTSGLDVLFGQRVDRILSLLRSSDGTLWAGTLFGLGRLRDGRWSAFDRGESRSVLGLFEAPNGEVWYARPWEGFGRISGDTVQAETLTHRPHCFAVDTQGVAWAGGLEGLWRIAGSDRRVLSVEDGLLMTWVTALLADPSGGLWVGSPKGLTRIEEDRVVAHFTTRDGLSDSGVTALHIDRDGILWVGTASGGLNRRRGRRFESVTRARGLTSNRVTAMLEDREKSLWVGTAGGLDRLRNGSLTPMGEAEGLPPGEASSIVAGIDGRVFASFGLGGLARVEGNAVTRLPGSQFDGALFASPDGTIWSGGADLLVARKNGRATPYPIQGNVSCIGSDGASVVFAINDGSVFRLVNGRQERYRLTDGRLLGPKDFAFDYVWMLYGARDGTLWVGTSRGVVAVRDGRARHVWSRGTSNARSFHEDEQGTLWVATNSGIVRIAGESVTTFTAKEGLPYEDLSHVLADRRGGIWASSGRGVFRLGRGELKAVAEGRARTMTAAEFGPTEGMRTAAALGTFQPAGCVTPDGRLWFTAGDGMVVIDPARIERNALAPPVVIESLLADDRPLSMNDSAVAPAGTRRLDIHFNGLSLVAPRRVRFQYRLEGYDRSWIEAGGQRAAHYMNLPPGPYSFRVKAANNDGIWSEASAPLRFVSAARFWQTWPFFTLLGLLVPGIGYAVHRLRVRATRAAFERSLRQVERELAERTEGERALRALNTKLGLALESGRMGTWSWSAATGAFSWSPEVHRITNGLTEGFEGGLPEFLSFVHVDDRQSFDRAIAAALTSPGKPQRFEARLLLAGGEERWYELRGQAFEEESRTVGAVGTIADVDDRRRADEERESLMKELATRNSELERFTYNVSHDLKSPLITIRGFLGFLEEDAVGGKVEQVREDAARIVDATTRMQRLLDELLDLSRVGRLSELPVTFSATDAVKDALALVGGRVDAARALVEVEPDLPMLYGDRGRIVQVLQNLIDNAASFMGGQLCPRIVIGARSDRKWPVVTVRDNGIGIARQYWERVFGLFEKLDPRSGGTGVGLALVKRIVEHHGGEVWVESDGEGMGSTFCFALPPPPLEET